MLWSLVIFVLLSLLLVLPLRWWPPLSSSFMMQRQWQSLGTEDGHEHIAYVWVPYERISPHMALAVVASEDQKFPSHNGFDIDAIRQVWTRREDDKPLRGASTISQQVAKNLYLWPARSLFRKALEAWFTLLLEALWPKQRILEIYLNIVELGEHTFGVEAASQHFFGKPATQLNRQEAALLAAVLPNPRLFRVDKPSAHVRQRQQWILRQMRQLGGPGYLNSP